MTIQRCPCCKQILRQTEKPISTRICYDCGEPILRKHRYTFQERQGNTAIVHRVCCNPEHYFRTAEAKKRGVVGFKNMSAEDTEFATKLEDELIEMHKEYRQRTGKEDVATNL